jgi:putative transposase
MLRPPGWGLATADTHLPTRRSIRLRDFDYRSTAAYFVTIVSHGRNAIFGHVGDGTVALTPLGRTIAGCWQAIPAHFPHASLDEVILMPNHLHGIVLLAGVDGGAATGARMASGSLGAVVRSFKAASTRQAKVVNLSLGGPLWQRGYYERVIRNDRELDALRAYVRENPLKWGQDAENPERR